MKCPFATPLVTHQFACSRAQEVVRRGGAEIDCTDSASHARCRQVFAQLKAVALPAFGVDDDLLSMPHSVVGKIQCGGLLGLQRLMHGQMLDKIDDVNALIGGVQIKFGDAMPAESVVADMTGYKLRARRR